MNMSNYFDLEEVFVNELFGDIWLFTIVGLVVIFFICLKSKIPFNVSILLSILFVSVCFSIETGTLLILWAFAIMGSGFLFYYGISKVLNR